MQDSLEKIFFKKIHEIGEIEQRNLLITKIDDNEGIRYRVQLGSSKCIEVSMVQGGNEFIEDEESAAKDVYLFHGNPNNQPKGIDIIDAIHAVFENAK